MKGIIALILFSFLIISCSSVKLPKAEESIAKASYFAAQTDSIGNIIRKSFYITNRNQTGSNDLTVKADIRFLNNISSGIANQRPDDVKLNFFKKPFFMKEDKNVLGINYTNHLDIDTGFVSVNLKKFNFASMNSNKIYANLELEGKGFINVSGKYTAIPGSVSPEVNIYLFEPVTFTLKASNRGNVQIVPDKKTLMMKTKFQVKLLEWKVPYYQEIPLQLTDILQPIELPVTMSSEISLPLPAQKFGKNNIMFAQFKLVLSQQHVFTDKNKLIYKADMNLERK